MTSHPWVQPARQPQTELRQRGSPDRGPFPRPDSGPRPRQVVAPTACRAAWSGGTPPGTRRAAASRVVHLDTFPACGGPWTHLAPRFTTVPPPGARHEKPVAMLFPGDSKINSADVCGAMPASTLVLHWETPTSVEVHETKNVTHITCSPEGCVRC